MSDNEVSQFGKQSLAANSVGVAHIVFFVVAAAAPMAAVVGATPPAFAFGNIGVPGAFVLVGLLYLIFSAGFTAMARHVSSAGGFYAYISRGLGRPFGVAGAFLAMVTYFAIQIGVYAQVGVFARAALEPLGIGLPWWFWSLLVLAAVLLCGQRHIVFSGRLLGICMIAELLILSLFALGVVLSGGGSEGLTASGLQPSDVFAPGLGVTLIFVVSAFIGFEATAIFGEEAAHPDQAIPRATVAAVIIITVFYAFVSWAVIQYYGSSAVAAKASESMENFYIGAIAGVLGGWSTVAVNILLLTSLFACLLSFHNTLNRYFYALGRDGLLWTGLSSVHHANGSPNVAGRVQSILVAAVLIGFSLIGADPYAVVYAWTLAFAGIGILAVQVLVSISILSFFRTERRGFSTMRVVIAPAVSGMALAAAFFQVSRNLPLLTGSESPIVTSFPVCVILIAVTGILTALHIRRTNPALYDRLDRTFAEATAET
ncbi:APC family permease [Agrobacterium leguminum]|uniref:APC family permease n=1 Tax=Rhizobiaceae TaxID=82115 RepID=UPI0014902043|nr:MULTISPECIES: APC family permease [Rhizobiaceae]MCZ7934814.1 APC family permease [Agrobacterium leguminum]MCZ7976949.1 APC family permease [Agrobacterium salinitolerans]NOV19235.1 APC family permease [Ensifer canadensis]NTA35450.1 APC family permease [Agrobacterium salinitolerans]